MHVISTTSELTAFSKELRERPFVAVDTEFMREKTYWPILCLIQAAADGIEAIIDPMADGIDLAPFLGVMADPDVTKVFHAARQDLEIFYRAMKQVPTPLFDSQIAAMACGFGDQIGYEPLMRNLLNASIDKGSRFTDWSRRPLTDKQLEYALSDVTHLREAYPILCDRLNNDGRMPWVEEETEHLNNPALYFVEPKDAWSRMKLRGIRQNEIGPLMKLAQWREEEAQRKDVPRNRILKDEGIFELARMRPKSPKELARARSVPSGFEKSKNGTALLEAIKDGNSIPKAELPNIESNKHLAPPPADVVDLLKVLLKRQCEHYSVAPKLIASTSDIEKIALQDTPDVPAMKGWRREVYGDVALRLKNGKIALKLTGSSVELVEQ